MDPVTQTLTALSLSEAGFKRKTRDATLALLVAANLADLDVVSRAWGKLAYLQFHRGPADSLLGTTLLGALTAGVIYALRKNRPPARHAPPLNAKWLLLGCWAAAGSHLLLDLANSYGVQLFWPWSARWYAADIEFATDPVLLALLLVGLGLPALLRLVSEEVGARRGSMQSGALVALALVAGLLSLRWASHRRALTALQSRTYHGQEAEAVAAFPTLANPFEWIGVAETPTAIEVAPINSLNGELDTESERIYYKPNPSAPLRAALKTRTLKVFMSFARFPWARVRSSRSGWVVTVQDLRFVAPGTDRKPMSAQVRLNKNLRVLSQTLRLK